MDMFQTSRPEGEDREKHRAPALPLMFSKENPTKPGQSVRQFLVLVDTGTSSSLLPYKVSKKLKLNLDTSQDLYVHTASNQRVRVTGVAHCFVKDHQASFWHLIRFLVIKEATVILIGNRDLKSLRLLDKNFPDFLGN